MTDLHLVRHAASAWTPDENRPLSAAGEADALQVAEVLSKFPITKILSSPYLRARETITPWVRATGLEMMLDNRFRERELGEIEGNFLGNHVEVNQNPEALEGGDP